MKTAWHLIKETFKEFNAIPTLSLSAAMAYYAAFSIGPILVLAVWLAGLVFGEHQMHQELDRQLKSFLGPSSTQLVENMMTAQFKSRHLSAAAVIGAVALVFGATGAFSQLQTSLNMIWGVTAKSGSNFWLLMRDRLLSMAMILAIAFLLLISMVLTAFVNAFAHYIGGTVSLPPWVAPAFDALISFLVIAVLFGLIFKVLPDVKIRWRDVTIGAMGTALLFTAGKFFLGLYLGHEISSSAYGAGSAFIVILLYVYYASAILFIGAEFTMVYARHLGRPFEPTQYAVPLDGGGRLRPQSEVDHRQDLDQAA